MDFDAVESTEGAMGGGRRYLLYCKDHGGLGEKGAYDYGSSCELEYIPKPDVIFENLEVTKCMLEDIKYSVKAYSLTTRFKSVEKWLKSLESELSDISSSQYQTLSDLYQLHTSSISLRRSIENSKEFIEINRFLAQRRAVVMNTEEGREGMRQVKELHRRVAEGYYESQEDHT